MPATNPAVDAHIRSQERWQAPMEALRRIAIEAGLDEQVKWRQPCYVSDGRNVALIQGFKEHCALLFFKGALLPDPSGLLQAMTENVQSARQFRCRDASEVEAARPALQALLRAAIEVERSGAKVPSKPPDQYETPPEFQDVLDRDPAVRKAFAALTPGRRRAYLLHFAGAKQSATRAARVAKNLPRILEGKGLTD